jgi:glycerol-3-phosphate dehydrogenase subunit C
VTLQLNTVERCSGHAGTYGVKTPTHPMAMKIGKPVFKAMAKDEPDCHQQRLRAGRPPHRPGHAAGRHAGQGPAAPAVPAAPRLRNLKGVTSMTTITRDSLMTLEAYAKHRKSSKRRGDRPPPPAQRALGEHMTLQFEDELTIRYQIQEMLHIEKIFDEDGIQSEIDAYAPLVPDGSNWKATLLLEYPDPHERNANWPADRRGGPHVRRGGRPRARATPSPTRTWSARTTKRPRPCTSCASSSRRAAWPACAPAPQ